MTEKIENVKEAERKFANWKREHSGEWTDALIHEEARWTFLDWKHYMESKGFTFAMSDEEFAKECEWLNMTSWQRFLIWMKKKPFPEKTIKAHRYIAIVYACLAVFCFGMAVFNVFMLARILKTSNSPALEEMIKAWKSVVFLAGVSAISGIFAVIGLLMFIFALHFYSCSLELRIKQLEKKVEAHGMREEKN